MSPSSHPDVALIVQARMGASRLPGKPLLKVLDKPLLLYLVERLKRVKYGSKLVVATTRERRDFPIVDLMQKEGIRVIRGSEEDVLSRYLLAARELDAKIIVRITADCPLIDPAIIDGAIHLFLKAKPPCDYLSNTLERTYPRGMDVEVFSRKALERANRDASSMSEREHVTLYLYRHPELFTLRGFCYKENFSHLRLTVDTKDDFFLIKKIVEFLYPKNPHFRLEDMLELLKKHPAWVKLNQYVKQKEV